MPRSRVMRFHRPPFDPELVHVVRGGTLRFDGRDFQNGEAFPIGPQHLRRSEQLYRMAKIVRPSELPEPDSRVEKLGGGWFHVSRNGTRVTERAVRRAEAERLAAG